MFGDRIQQPTTSTGAVMTLGTASTNFRAFSSVFATGANVQYAVRSQDGTKWETGFGRLTGANELTRDYSTGNSSATQPSLITFSAGTQYVTSTPVSRGIVPAMPPVIATPASGTGKIVSNRFGYLDVVGGLTAALHTNDVVYYLPILLEQGARILGVGFNVASYVGSFTVDAGIYSVVTETAAANPGLPGVRLSDATEISVTSTGLKIVEFSARLTLPTGPYFIALLFKTTNLAECTVIMSPPQMSWLGASNTSLYPYVGCYESSTALPATANTTQTLATFVSDHPWMCLISE